MMNLTKRTWLAVSMAAVFCLLAFFGLVFGTRLTAFAAQSGEFKYADAELGDKAGSAFQIAGEGDFYQNYEFGYAVSMADDFPDSVTAVTAGTAKRIVALKNLGSDGTSTIVAAAVTRELDRIEADASITDAAEKAAFKAKFQALCDSGFSVGRYRSYHANWNGGNLTAFFFGDMTVASYNAQFVAGFLFYNPDKGEAFLLADEFAKGQWDNKYSAKYGKPVSDTFAYGSVRTQNFENGYLQVGADDFKYFYGVNLAAETGKTSKLQSVVDASVAGMRAHGNIKDDAKYPSAAREALLGKYTALYDAGIAVGWLNYAPDSGAWNSGGNPVLSFSDNVSRPANPTYGSLAMIYNAKANKAYCFYDDWFDEIFWANKCENLGAPVSDSPNGSGISSDDEKTSVKVGDQTLTFAKGAMLFDKGYAYRGQDDTIVIVGSLRYDYEHNEYVESVAAPSEFGNFVSDLVHDGVRYYNFDKGYCTKINGKVGTYFGFNVSSEGERVKLQAAIDAEKAKIGSNNGSGFITDAETVQAFQAAYQRLYDLGFSVGIYDAGQDVHYWNGIISAIYVYGDGQGEKWASANVITYNPALKQAYLLTDEFFDALWDNKLGTLGSQLGDSPNKENYAPTGKTTVVVDGKTLAFDGGVVPFDLGYAYVNAEGKLTFVDSLIYDKENDNYLKSVSLAGKPYTFGALVGNLIHKGVIYYNFERGFAKVTNGAAIFTEFENVMLGAGDTLVRVVKPATLGEFGAETARYTVGKNVYINYERGAIRCTRNAADTAYDVSYHCARSFSAEGALSSIDDAQLAYYTALIETAIDGTSNLVPEGVKERIVEKYTELWEGGYVAGIIDGRGLISWNEAYCFVFYFGDDGYKVGLDTRVFSHVFIYDYNKDSIVYMNGRLMQSWQVNRSNLNDNSYAYGAPVANPVKAENGDLWQSFEKGTLIYTKNGAIVFMSGGAYADYAALPEFGGPSHGSDPDKGYIGDKVKNEQQKGCSSAVSTFPSVVALLVLCAAAALLILKKRGNVK